MGKRTQVIIFLITASVSSLFLFNCSNSDVIDPQVTSLTENAPQLSKTNFVTDLQEPWDMAFTADGSMLFTEKCIGLSVRKNTGEIVRLFGVAGTGALLPAPDMFCEGQSGANGIALDPDFENNRAVFLFMASNLFSVRTNRVVRLTVNVDFTAVTDRTDIIMDIPFKNQSNSWGAAGSHSGGRLRFAPDGHLLVTTGDNHNGKFPQDNLSLAGKVLRVDRNGKAAPDNIVTSGDARIYTYGHRNVQGLCFHPDTGDAYIAEHGPNHSDEVTLLTSGGNGGWDPQPDSGVTCEDNYCGYISNNLAGTPTSMTDLNKFPNAMKPVLSQNDSQGMGPCTFLVGSQWKGWDRALVLGIMVGTRTDIVKVTTDGVLIDQVTANLPSARIRSTVQAGDGNLYIATDAGEIWKVSPQP